MNRDIKCVMCQTPLSFEGTYKFHEGPHHSVLGNTAFINKIAFDVYECPKCGKVELYAENKKEL